MNEIIIEAQDVWRRYQRKGQPAFDAVRGVNLSIARGELFALLGTNGAGKTSFLELLEGLAAPSQGNIAVLGHNPYTDAAKVRHRTGVMLQEAGFPGDLTVMEMAKTWAGTLPSPQPVAKVLDAVHLTKRAKVSIASLSGGERRRLDLALALLGDPEVIFLDEPTTGLDPESRRNTWKLIQDLQDQGVTMILTTHYLEEAEQLATRLAVMNAGVIVQEGTVESIAASVPGQITFRIDQAKSATLPNLRGNIETKTRNGENSFVIRTHHLQADLTTLLAWASEHNLVLAGLDARAASLEQAFLTLTEQEN